MLRSPPTTRASHAAAYLLFAAAGASAAIWPSPAVLETSRGGLILSFWVGFLIIGGGVSAWGRIFGRWLGEFLGLPALATVFIIYGLSALYAGVADGRYTAVPGGLALQAITGLVIARWAEVNAIRLEAMHQADHDRSTRERTDEVQRRIEGGD